MEYYDLNELAVYLHKTPRQIQRMADRGQLPGQKIENTWRFSRQEIFLWLEQKLNEQEYCELIEDTLVCVSDLIPPEMVLTNLNCHSLQSVLEQLTNAAVETGMLWSGPDMIDAVMQREKMVPTTLDCRVALLHPRRPMTRILDTPFIALGILPSPIPTGGQGARLNLMADVFFLICSTDDTTHLRTLARVSRLINQRDFLTNLRNAGSPEEVLSVISIAEEALDN